MTQLVHVCQHVVQGTATLVQLAVRGQLRREHVWVGVKGAGLYAKAVANGDVADQPIVNVRLGPNGCGGCPSRTITNEFGYEAWWCGTPFVEGRDEHGPTCGCMLQGKAAVGSEACLRGNW